MKKLMIWLIAVALVAIAGFYVALSRLTKPTPQAPQMTATKPVTVEPSHEEPATHYPIATKSVSNPMAEIEPLPSLHDSDRLMQGALLTLLKKQSFVDYFNLDGIVQRVVVTIDNLPRESLAVQLRPLKPTEGTFRVLADGDTLVMAPSNSERYETYIRMMQAVDTKTLVSLYARFYPLFQQAYQELGYPNGYFNDRLITVIDHLIACPDAPDSLRLTQPHVYFTFADPALEHMSAGDKILFRIGKANAGKVKQKLREIRAELISKSDATL